MSVATSTLSSFAFMHFHASSDEFLIRFLFTFLSPAMTFSRDGK
jgi:hypothetical protein